MENSKESGIFTNNLIYVLQKITESQSKIFDQIYLEKLLTSIRLLYEFKGSNDEECSPELLEWLTQTLQKWKNTQPRVYTIEFVSCFIGILCKNEQVYSMLQAKLIIQDLIDILQKNFCLSDSLKLVLIRLLCNILKHNTGFQWVKTTQQWKFVIQVCFTNSNLHIEREGQNFVALLVERAKEDNHLIEEMFKEILLPINKREENFPYDKYFFSKINISFKLLETMLKVCSFSENNSIWLILHKIFDVEPFLKFILENCNQETVQDISSRLYVMFLIVKHENKQKLLLLQHVPVGILDIFNILLNKGQIKSIIKLANFCQVMWSKMRNELKDDSKAVKNFIVLQLVPAIIYNKKPPNTKLFDLYVQKMFNITSNSTQKFCYSLRDVIRNKDSNLKDWAIKGVLSVTGNVEYLNQDEAVIIFQSIAYVLKAFICDGNADGSKVNEDYQSEEILCVIDANLLSAVLKALCILIEKFKINWSESLESLCLLKMTCNLLQNPQLSAILIVQTLLLVKLAIQNFMSPDLALLVNTTDDSSFECLMELLYKRMHDPNWEVRDSCIEVVITIAEFGELKYPAFQQLLQEKDFCALVFSIMNDDGESYVRASALRALSAITKIESLKHCIRQENLTSKGFEILQTESEGIVRREAALLIKQLYLCQDETSDSLDSFYQIMAYAAICDLHWEVKLNSLLFWEAVIQRSMANQGMIDGSFPKVTFSKEHRKIVTLTSDEIKVRLDKVLNELSKTGCLFVLLSTLNNDCDFQVVQKSAHITANLLEILKQYDVIQKDSNIETLDKISLKRKNTEFYNLDKRKPPDLFIDEDSDGIFNEHGVLSNDDTNMANSDKIIEEIVNEMDINLLVNVRHPRQENNFSEKKIWLQEIKPEMFLFKMKNIDFEQFLETKNKCFLHSETDLNFFLNDIVSIDSLVETNMMDCY